MTFLNSCPQRSQEESKRCPRGCGYFIHLMDKDDTQSTWYPNFWCLKCGTKLPPRTHRARAAKRPLTTKCKQCKRSSVFARNGDDILSSDNQIFKFENANFCGEEYDLVEAMKAKLRALPVLPSPPSVPPKVFEKKNLCVFVLRASVVLLCVLLCLSQRFVPFYR